MTDRVPAAIDTITVGVNSTENLDGWKVGSDRCRDYWLPILGPASIVVAEWVCHPAHPTATFPLADWSALFGLSPSNMIRTCARLHQYRAATWVTYGDRTASLVVRTRWPQIPEPLLRRLPEPLRLSLQSSSQ